MARSGEMQSTSSYIYIAPISWSFLHKMSGSHTDPFDLNVAEHLAGENAINSSNDISNDYGSFKLILTRR